MCEGHNIVIASLRQKTVGYILHKKLYMKPTKKLCTSTSFITNKQARS